MDTQRILIVEDDPADRLLVHRVLDSLPLDLEVVDAATLAEARDALEENGFRWILADHRLPDGDAGDLLDAVSPIQPDCAVVILTGRGDESLAAELMREGARDYIPKATLTGDRLEASLRSSAAIADAESMARSASEGYRFLAEAGEALVGALEVDDVTEAATRRCLGVYADFCILDVEEARGGFRRLAFGHRDAELERAHRETIGDATLAESFRSELEAEGEPVEYELDEAALERLGLGGPASEALCAPGSARLRTIPLVARGRAIGYLTIARGATARGGHALPILNRFCDLVALALDSAMLYERLETAVNQRERLLGVVAHELRNPLTAIAGSVGNMLALELSEESRRRQLDLVAAATDRMSRLVEDLLDVSRLEEGALRVRPGPVSPDELLEEAATGVSGLEANQLTVERESEVGGRVRADRGRTIQVLANLLANAVRHSPRGGRIRLTAVEDGGVVRFAVRDEGPGIEAGQLPRLFERFWQASDERKRGSAGLGLAIAKGLVEAQGGEIGVESQPGVGTEFWFTLPIAQD